MEKRRRARHEQQELERIEAALNRLDTGRFGYCGVCGDALELAALDQDPTISTCAHCLKRAH